MIKVEVIYALPDTVHVKQMQITDGSTIMDAITRSGILETCPEIDLEKNRVGIFSQLKDLDTRITDGDRVEIYRPLIANPKDARRKRAAS